MSYEASNPICHDHCGRHAGRLPRSICRNSGCGGSCSRTCRHCSSAACRNRVPTRRRGRAAGCLCWTPASCLYSTATGRLRCTAASRLCSATSGLRSTSAGRIRNAATARSFLHASAGSCLSRTITAFTGSFYQRPPLSLQTPLQPSIAGMESFG